MLAFFRENFRLLRQGKGLLRFELFYKLAGVGILIPTLLTTLNFSLRIAGLTYLTNDNFVRYLTHPAGLSFFLLTFAVWGFYNLAELSGLTIYFYAAHHGRRMPARQIFTVGLRCAARLFRPRNFWMYPFLVLILPMTILPLLLAYAATIQIPEFIVRYVSERGWLLGLFFLLLAAMFCLSLRWIFSLCFFAIEGRSFPQSRRDSAALLKGRAGFVAARLLGWQTLLLAGFLVLYLLFLSAALLISKIFIPGTMAMTIFVGIFQWCNLGVLFLAFCFGLPMCSIAVSRLYLLRKRETGQRLPPLRALNLPHGRRLEPGIKWGVTAIVAVLAVLNVGYIYPAVSRGTFGFVEALARPTVTAHRGDSKSAPENTMAAFRAAVENGADFIELDVQQLQDGTLILMHDSNFLRTAGVNLNVWDVTLPEVREMEVGSWFDQDFAGEPVPLLEEALEFARENRIRLNIELKSTGHETGLEQAVADLIREYRMEDECVITSLQYGVLERMKQAAPELTTGYILSVAYGPFYSMEYADLFSVRADFVTMGMVRGLHNTGKRLFVWTVNDEASIQHLIEMHVDSIITDNVVLARALVDAPAANPELLRVFEQFFTGGSFSRSAMKLWKVIFRPS